MGVQVLLSAVLTAGLILSQSGAFANERSAPGQLVVRPSNPNAPLAERFAAGLREGAKAGGSGFWIGYSIQRLMEERSYIGSWGRDVGGEGRTLGEMIRGGASTAVAANDREAAVKDAARRALGDLDKSRVPDRLVMKEIGILFKFPPAGGKTPEEIRMSDLKLSVKLGGHALVWLGSASDAESLSLLTSMFDRSDGAASKVREILIHAVVLHRAPDTVLPFLEKVLSGPGEGKVRRAAVIGLAEVASEKAVGMLERLAFDDKDTEVQKMAVFVLADQPEKEAAPFLVRVAKTHDNPDVRKAAIFALGDLGNAEAVAALLEIARGRTR